MLLRSSYTVLLEWAWDETRLADHTLNDGDYNYSQVFVSTSGISEQWNFKNYRMIVHKKVQHMQSLKRDVVTSVTERATSISFFIPPLNYYLQRKC